MGAKKVFISYSHDSQEHCDRVLELADRLNNAGIECMIDQYISSPSSGWPLWMEEQIIMADYVLMVCTETYNNRVHKKGEPDKGFGVCWEANIIYNSLYEGKLENDKFIPILFTQYNEGYIPRPLRGYTLYHVYTKKGFEDLYRFFTNQQLITKPELGQVRKLSSPQRHSSFFNFPEQIDRTLDTTSVCIHNLPLFNQANHFGREEFLAQLRNIFTSSNTAALTQAISGLGGVGKTQIARAYAYAYKENYRYIWWIRAENPLTCDLDYQDFARRIDLCKPDADRKQIIEKIREWQEKNGEWLFIFDNATEYATLQDYLPRFQKGHILITTRNNHFKLKYKLPVDVFPLEVAAEFFGFRTGLNEPKAALALGREMGGLPLALEQAAAYIEENQLTLQEYLDQFQQYKLRLFKETEPPENYHSTVTTTWQISLEKITEEATRQLLYLSAFLDPDKISKQLLCDGVKVLPHSLAKVVIDKVMFNMILAQLDTYSLIQRHGDFWSIHRLVQEVVRNNLGHECVNWAGRIVELLCNVYDFNYYQQSTWEKAGQLIPHMQAAVETAVSLQLENHLSGTLCNKIGLYLYYQGQYQKTESYLKKAIEIRELVLGLNHLDTASTLDDIVGLYFQQGCYKKAEPICKRVLEIREQVLGPDHPDTAITLNNLAFIYKNEGRYEEAEPLFKRALEINERVQGPDHPDTAGSLNNLALLYKNQGWYEKAKPLYERALAIRERALGPDHPDTATSLNNLAGLYDSQRRDNEAEPLFKRALEIRERALGLDHPDTASSLDALAVHYYIQSRYEEAELLCKRALEIRERVLGLNHPDTANSLKHLADLYKNQGRYNEAEPLYKRALEIREQELGPDHPATATSLNNLAGLYDSQGRYEEEELLFKRALENRERVLGPDHPETANSLNNLALLYNNQGRYEEAELLYKRALEIFINVFGIKYPSTQKCKNNLVAFYESQNQTAAVKELMEKFKDDK